MPFFPETKAKMFIRSARICCLCFKQCGTNIEAAHIIAEADGGTNDESNGIPLCLDCHQEIGAYDPRHPRGNRFTPVELRARRDQLYRLVESGSIQAMLIADRIHANAKRATKGPTLTQVDLDQARSYAPSAEADGVLKEAVASKGSVESLPRKLLMLSSEERAWVLDKLLQRFTEGGAIDALAVVASAGKNEDESLILLEQLLRKVTLAGEIPAKARLMKVAPIDLLERADEGLRLTFFADVIEVMEKDQYQEVNLVTPAVVRVQRAIPSDLRPRYVIALLSQARSHAYEGAPAARAALAKLPAELQRAAWEALDARELLWHLHSDTDTVRAMIAEGRAAWPPERRTLYNDFLELAVTEFAQKYWAAQEDSR